MNCRLRFRREIRKFVENSIVTIVMSLVTIFALVGDDVRIWFTNKDADPIFYWSLIVSMLLFTIEILLNTLVIDDFQYSFFFWLDIIATLSLIPDIRWLIDLLGFLFNWTPSYLQVNVVPGEITIHSVASSKVQKVIKSVRLIRLIRIIKLYKYIVQSKNKDKETDVDKDNDSS